MMLCAVVQGAWAQWGFGGGTGTEDDPYIIRYDHHWKTLVDRVNSGEYEGFKGKYFELMNDLEITEKHTSGYYQMMVGVEGDGKDATRFCGIFDGNGHTITLDIKDTSSKLDFCAPFRYIKNATIMNLNIKGKVYRVPEGLENPKNNSALVGKAEGNNNILNCRCSAIVELGDYGGVDVSSGGFIGELRGGGTTTMNNCLFDGQLIAYHVICWGGFVGYVAKGNTITFNNCLFAPSFIQINTGDKDDDSRTFARLHKDAKINVNNCYYKTMIKEAQGATDAREYSPEQLQAALGNGWKISGDKVQPRLRIYTFKGDGTEESPYKITSAVDWRYLTDYSCRGDTYEGKYFLLANDITVNHVMAEGFTEKNSFKGIFDGGNHTLTLNYSNTDHPYIGLFRRVDGATFKNLHVTGNITVKVDDAGGLIGLAKGDTKIINCRSSVTINCTYEGDKGPLAALADMLYGRYYSGFVGVIYGGKTVFTGCVFDGILKGVEGSPSGYSAGFVGEIRSENDKMGEVEFNDCISNGDIFLDSNTCYQFVQGDTSKTVTYNHSYYVSALNDTEQGMLMHSITADKGIAMEVAGKATKYDVSGITSYSAGILYDNTKSNQSDLVAGEGEMVKLNLDYDCPPGYSVEYAVSRGTLSGKNNPYTLKMPYHSVNISAKLVESQSPAEITLVDGADNSEVLAQYDGQTVNVTYDRVLSAVDNGDGTWTPRCYTICLPYDFDLYKSVGGQANLYRLKYVDTDNDEFIFTNDFGYATRGMAWLIVVNYGTVSLNATNVQISAQPWNPEFVEVYDYKSKLDQPENPRVVGYWSGPFCRIHDDEAEVLYVYGMQDDGSWQRCVVTDQGPKWSWIETFRGVFLSIEPLEADTFKPMYTYTGAGDEEETGEIEPFPTVTFEGDYFHKDPTGISPAIRTIEADGSSRIFDLQGRQIEGEPAKGLYIKNGKKYLSK